MFALVEAMTSSGILEIQVSLVALSKVNDVFIAYGSSCFGLDQNVCFQERADLLVGRGCCRYGLIGYTFFCCGS